MSSSVENKLDEHTAIASSNLKFQVATCHQRNHASRHRIMQNKSAMALLAIKILVSVRLLDMMKH